MVQVQPTAWLSCASIVTAREHSGLSGDDAMAALELAKLCASFANLACILMCQGCLRVHEEESGKEDGWGGACLQSCSILCVNAGGRLWVGPICNTGGVPLCRAASP